MRVLISALMLVLFFSNTLSQRSSGHAGASSHGSPQQHSVPRANQGRIPPAPRAGAPADGAERYGDGRTNSLPHVNHDQWYGHDVPNDPRYRQTRPFEHGTFSKAGPVFRYRIVRVDRALHRFWIGGGFYFVVAPWDWPLFADWCWDCGDDFVVYDDPLHPGWYLLYNVHTGVYVHVQYWGE